MLLDETNPQAIGEGCQPIVMSHPLPITLPTETSLICKEKEQLQTVTQGYLNQSFQDNVPSPEKQNAKRLTENKLRHKKLKQKLNILSEQILDQGILKQQKDMTSPNKSRLLKLAIELDKAIRIQAIDYPQVESILREIQKIVEHKREHDLLILRGARVMTTLIAMVKRFPSLHRTEAAQSMTSMELSLRLLRIMLTLSSSRQLLLITNQLTPISSLLSCALMRQDKKLATACLYLLNMVLAGPNRIQLHQIINANLEYILCSFLLKRLKSYLEMCISEDDPSHAEFILIAFKFYYFVLTRCCEKELARPIYGTPVMDNLSRAISAYFQSGLQLLLFSIVQLVFEKEEGEEKYMLREDDLPNFKINILLYIFKCLNVIFHVNIAFAQKMMECSSIFIRSLSFIFSYVNENFKENTQFKGLSSQIIVFIGNIACENHSLQNTIRESGLLNTFCNHPLECLMEPLKHLYFPALCSLIHDNPLNFKAAFAQNSVLSILQYIQKQINNCNQKKIEDEPCIELGVPKNPQGKTLSRKTSVSSMNSTYSTYSKTSMAESFSTQGSLPSSWMREPRLDYKIRQQYWEGLQKELRKIDE